MRQEQALLRRVGGTVAIFSRSSDRPAVGSCRPYMPLGGVVKTRGVDWYVTELILRHIRTADFWRLYHQDAYMSSVMMVENVVWIVFIDVSTSVRERVVRAFGSVVEVVVTGVVVMVVCTVIVEPARLN
jgi:hypothetical protein